MQVEHLRQRLKQSKKTKDSKKSGDDCAAYDLTLTLHRELAEHLSFRRGRVVCVTGASELLYEIPSCSLLLGTAGPVWQVYRERTEEGGELVTHLLNFRKRP